MPGTWGKPCWPGGPGPGLPPAGAVSWATVRPRTGRATWKTRAGRRRGKSSQGRAETVRQTMRWKSVALKKYKGVSEVKTKDPTTRWEINKAHVFHGTQVPTNY